MASAGLLSWLRSGRLVHTCFVLWARKLSSLLALRQWHRSSSWWLPSVSILVRTSLGLIADVIIGVNAYAYMVFIPLSCKTLTSGSDRSSTGLRPHHSFLLSHSESLDLLAVYPCVDLCHTRHRLVHSSAHWRRNGWSWRKPAVAEERSQSVHGRHRHAGRLHHSLPRPGRQIPSRPTLC